MFFFSSFFLEFCKVRSYHRARKSLSAFTFSIIFAASHSILNAKTDDKAGDLAEKWLKTATSQKEKLLKLCHSEDFRLSAKLRQSFLNYAKSQARYELALKKVILPEIFLKWAESEPVIEASVYGAHLKASEVLQHLYALQLDLGEEKFRQYHQLMLAEAIVNAKRGKEADLTPRELLTLKISGDPRKSVNTKDSSRELDMNDHIINFLNENTIEEEVVIGHKLPELKYDERGIAIQPPKRKKQKKIPVTEKRTRTLYAADIIASRELQQKFNAYMKSKGHTVEIDCGDRIIHWKSRDMVRGEQYKKIKNAYDMFHEAYKAKGLLPNQRDSFPTPGEECAFIIRNNDYKFADEVAENRKWPRYPLTSPWPTLLMLAENNQPLRERQERWEAFRDKGEFKTYGEYIGGVAQQFDMQSARRIKPYPFTYGTIQMMLKDGGVCGTMGNISARSHNILGIPATTAGQPGHCAMVAYRYDEKTKTYRCKGAQYATGGDDKTTPHSGWYFGEFITHIRKRRGKEFVQHQRKPMVYHQSVAWAVNYGMESFLDSLIAHSIFRTLPESAQQSGGVKLLVSGLAKNPYSYALVDSGQQLAKTPEEQIKFWKEFSSVLATVKEKPGCPVDSLYNRTVKNSMFKRIANLPVPEDKQVAREVYKFLEEEKCDNPLTMSVYRLALDGLPTLLANTESDFENHLKSLKGIASRENDKAAAKMAETIKAVSGMIKNRKERKKWALKLWEKGKGSEKYFGHKYRISTNPAIVTLSRLTRQKLPAEAELFKPILNEIESELKKSVNGTREVKSCRVLSGKISGAARSLKDQLQKKAWLESLNKEITGKEKFIQKFGKRKKSVNDPCAVTINKLLESIKQ